MSVAINRCLNASSKLYGLSTFGVVLAGISMLIVWLIISMAFGMLVLIPGYITGAAIGKLWHKGKLQQSMYWHLPVSRLLGGSSLPESYHRRYL